MSLGLAICDLDKRPIIFNETVRPFLLEFLARQVNAQLRRLKQLIPNTFMFIDEPGLQFVFRDNAARRDLELYFSLLERPVGIHLCGNFRGSAKRAHRP